MQSILQFTIYTGNVYNTGTLICGGKAAGTIVAPELPHATPNPLVPAKRQPYRRDAFQFAGRILQENIFYHAPHLSPLTSPSSSRAHNSDLYSPI